ncbi:MAG: hypothetical protein HC889_00600 [Synechococcaceae cyanobacterium SM1_2_3]|nr:hypothetical protein [Synechococcaceae cyanobacterium SM1_2_3]
MAKRKRRSDCRIRLNDECRRLGCGVRGVQVLKRGRRWVHFRETATGIVAKLPLRDFDRAVVKGV